MSDNTIPNNEPEEEASHAAASSKSPSVGSGWPMLLQSATRSIGTSTLRSKLRSRWRP